MDEKTFGVISTISGLVVGWTLNELSSFFKSKSEKKKVLNKTLFLQLEIRDVIRKTDLEFVEQQISDFLKKRFPEMDFVLLQNTVGKIFYAFIQKELNDKFSFKIDGLIKQYTSHLDFLSQIDPFSTYYISSKDTVLDYLGYVNRYLSAIEPYLNKQVISDDQADANEGRTFEQAFSSIRNTMTPMIRESALETIEHDARLIARKIGLWQYHKTNRFLKSTQKIQIDNTDLKKVEDYLNQLSPST